MSKFTSKILSAKAPAASVKNPKFTGGEGVAIVNDFKVIDGEGGPTYILETVIKSSKQTHPALPANPAGTRADNVEVLTKKGADSRVKGIILAILGPSLESADDAENQVKELLREDETGYTVKGSECPMRGAEVEFFTSPGEFTNKDTGEKETGAKVRFRHVPFNPETVKANLALLDGK